MVQKGKDVSKSRNHESGNDLYCVVPATRPLVFLDRMTLRYPGHAVVREILKCEDELSQKTAYVFSGETSSTYTCLQCNAFQRVVSSDSDILFKLLPENAVQPVLCQCEDIRWLLPPEALFVHEKKVVRKRSHPSAEFVQYCHRTSCKVLLLSIARWVELLVARTARKTAHRPEAFSQALKDVINQLLKDYPLPEALSNSIITSSSISDDVTDPALELETSVLDESFTLFYTLLRYSELTPPAFRTPNTNAKEPSDTASATILRGYHQGIEQAISPRVWYQLVAILDIYAVPIACSVPWANELYSRLSALSPSAVETLLNQPYWQDKLQASKVFLEDDSSPSSAFTTAVDTTSSSQRDFCRLLQTWQRHSEPENPFHGVLTYQALLLTPTLAASGRADTCLSQSCLSNTYVKATATHATPVQPAVDQSSSPIATSPQWFLDVQLLSVRPIAAHEALTYDFGYASSPSTSSSAKTTRSATKSTSSQRLHAQRHQRETGKAFRFHRYEPQSTCDCLQCQFRNNRVQTLQSIVCALLPPCFMATDADEPKEVDIMRLVRPIFQSFGSRIDQQFMAAPLRLWRCLYPLFRWIVSLPSPPSSPSSSSASIRNDHITDIASTSLDWPRLLSVHALANACLREGQASQAMLLHALLCLHVIHQVPCHAQMPSADATRRHVAKEDQCIADIFHVLCTSVVDLCTTLSGANVRAQRGLLRLHMDHLSLLELVARQGLRFDPQHRAMASFCCKMHSYASCRQVPVHASWPPKSSHEDAASSPSLLSRRASSSLSSLVSLVDRKDVGVASLSEDATLTADECMRLIIEAEDIAAQNGGWTTARHYSVPTTDLPLHALSSETVAWFADDVLCQRLAPAMHEVFKQSPTSTAKPTLAQDETHRHQPSKKDQEEEPVSKRPRWELACAATSSSIDVRVTFFRLFVVFLLCHCHVVQVEGEEETETSPTSSVAMGILVVDLFVVKYAHGGDIHGQQSGSASQRFLPLHRDQSAHSAVLSLSQPQVDFTGGGTYFADLHASIAPGTPSHNIHVHIHTLHRLDHRLDHVEQGQLLCFHGDLLHGGDVVVRGTRYIIAGFFVLYEINTNDAPDGLLANDDVDGDREHSGSTPGRTTAAIAVEDDSKISSVASIFASHGPSSMSLASSMQDSSCAVDKMLEGGAKGGGGFSFSFF